MEGPTMGNAWWSDHKRVQNKQTDKQHNPEEIKTMQRIEENLKHKARINSLESNKKKNAKEEQEKQEQDSKQKEQHSRTSFWK